MGNSGQYPSQTCLSANPMRPHPPDDLPMQTSRQQQRPTAAAAVTHRLPSYKTIQLLHIYTRYYRPLVTRESRLQYADSTLSFVYDIYFVNHYTSYELWHIVLFVFYVVTINLYLHNSSYCYNIRITVLYETIQLVSFSRFLKFWWNNRLLSGKNLIFHNL